EHINRGAAVDEVQHHLCRHLRRIRTYARGCNAMIGHEYICSFPQRKLEVSPSNRNNLSGKGLELSEAAERLGQLIQMLYGMCQVLRIQWLDALRDSVNSAGCRRLRESHSANSLLE